MKNHLLPHLPFLTHIDCRRDVLEDERTPRNTLTCGYPCDAEFILTTRLNLTGTVLILLAECTVYIFASLKMSLKSHDLLSCDFNDIFRNVSGISGCCRD